jgi:hypothetical protein
MLHEEIPVVGQSLKFARLAKNITNCTNPTEACLKAAKLIMIDCLPPHVKYPLKCAALGIQIVIAANGGTPIAIALVLALSNQILEEHV